MEIKLKNVTIEIKRRLDDYITDKFLLPSRNVAATLIKEGKVLVNGTAVTKCAKRVSVSDDIKITKMPRYVSRGGYKLAKALKVFNIEVMGCRALDVGASTGGFTDCMLQEGARAVYALDVGHDQLAPTLRINRHVICLERMDVRDMAPLHLPKVDFVSVDVSFISLTKVFPCIAKVVHPGTHCVALVKPQFEVGRFKVGKKGIVRNPEFHIEAIKQVCAAAQASNFAVKGLDYSPILGKEGNIEYLLLLKFDYMSIDIDIAGVVAKAHKELGGH